MSSRRRADSDLLALLRTISTGDKFPPLSSFSDRQIRWIIKTGLAPLFCFAGRNDPNRVAARSWRDLKAADLSIRVVNDIQLETLSEILNRCKDLLPPITLLKGCSIGSELYPQPHLRVMRDLDLLVSAKEQPILEALLLEMGFQQQSTNSAEYYAMHHHSMPFYHCAKGVWVEVHTGLFPPREKLANLAAFNSETIAAESRRSLLNEIPVMRLSTELQIIYTASHWALGLKREGGLFALLDTIYILRQAQRDVRWNLIFKWVQSSVAATHLYLLLSYLDEKDVLDVDWILQELFVRQRSFGILNLKIAHHLITRYLVAGNIPIAQGKVAILWQNLLLDEGPAQNLASFCKKMVSPLGLQSARFV
jgi:Uncharacterised nucleotidyltransferase